MKLMILSILSGILNRLGGIGKPFNTKYRDWGVPLCGIIYLYPRLPQASAFWLWMALAGFFAATWGALSTYWDKWGTDGVEWYEWALHGFMIGLAAFPIAIYTGNWAGLVVRTAILTVFMPFSNKFQCKIFWDGTDGVEGARGIIIMATLGMI